MTGAGAPSGRPLYVFLDEGGDFNFSPGGTRHFTLTSVVCERPFPLDAKITDLRFDLLEAGLDIEYFHASEDRQAVRDQVFALIASSLGSFRVDTVVVEKPKAPPALQAPASFYPRMIGHLLGRIVRECAIDRTEIIAITDRIPVNKKRNAVEKAVKSALKQRLPTGVQHRVLHHDSKSCVGLQIADYFNWAVFRKWERSDARSHAIVAPALKSEFEIFPPGSTEWY